VNGAGTPATVQVGLVLVGWWWWWWEGLHLNLVSHGNFASLGAEKLVFPEPEKHSLELLRIIVKCVCSGCIFKY
jgi:hypothetical protein